MLGRRAVVSEVMRARLIVTGSGGRKVEVTVWGFLDLVLMQLMVVCCFQEKTELNPGYVVLARITCKAERG
jgi:hypothetical protein